MDNTQPENLRLVTGLASILFHPSNRNPYSIIMELQYEDLSP